jgi:kynurenine 3-monooxygenase
MPSSKPAEQSVLLVGAGLVGSLLSIFLARRGRAIEIRERRPDMRRERISAGRSINLAISTRGLSALGEVGLREEALRNAIPMKGRIMHAVSGELTFQSYGKDDSQYINSISRAWLNQRLMTAAEETGKVAIRFNSRATAFDAETGECAFRDEKRGAEVRVRANVVIGTDGSASAIRQEIARRTGAPVSQEHLAHGYKELVIPPAEGGGFRMERNALHIWPRGTYMLIALPNLDGSFTCTLFLPMKGPLSFESLDTPAKVLEFFRAQFPDAVPLIPRLTEDFSGNPTGSMVTVKCAPWHWRDRAVLLGDAAHAIVPFFGQGMNCGFEDCTVIDSLLESRGENWGAAFEEFSRLRKPDADAIADMAVENFVEMRDRVADPRFLLEKQVEKALMTEFPGRYVSRYSMVSFSTIPYRLAYEAGRIQAGILAELCRGIDRPEQLDLARARTLVEERLDPFMKGTLHGSQAKR